MWKTKAGWYGYGFVTGIVTVALGFAMYSNTNQEVRSSALPPSHDVTQIRPGSIEDFPNPRDEGPAPQIASAS